MGVEVGAEDVAGSAGVCQQLMDGDLGGDLPVGVVGEICGEGSGQLDLAGLDQLKSCDRGEHLVHRSDAKARADGVRDPSVAVGQSVGVAEEHAAVLGDQHRAGELIFARELVGAGRDRLQRVRFGHPVEDEVQGACRLLGVRKLDSGVRVRADRLETDVVHAGAQRTSIVGSGETQAHGLARPARHVDAHGARLATVRIAGRGRKDVRQDIPVRHGVDRRRGSDEVDPELLIGPGLIVGERLRAAQTADPRIEHGQVQPEATLQLHVPVQDPRPGTVRVAHRREPALGRIGQIEGNVRITPSGIGCLAAIGVDEPAPRAAADGPPTGQRAGFEVIHDEHRVLLPHRTLRPVAAPREKQAHGDPHDQRPPSDHPPALRAHSRAPACASSACRRAHRGDRVARPAIRFG